MNLEALKVNDTGIEQAHDAVQAALGLNCFGVIALPNTFQVHDLEKYLDTRRHMSGTMRTSSEDHFAQYVKANREIPITAHGNFSEIAKVVMEALGAAPHDLWTDTQLAMRLKKSSGETEMSGDQVSQLLENHVDAMTLPDPFDAVYATETQRILSPLLQGEFLSSRERQVMGMRFGACEKTISEVAEALGLSISRVQQIEKSALRKFRHITRVKELNPTAQRVREFPE